MNGEAASATRALRFAWRAVPTALFLSLAFLAALTLACLIPRSAIQHHARQSGLAMIPHGGYPRAFGIKSKAFQLDYYSDARMLNIAYSADNRRPLHAALADSLSLGPEDAARQLHLGRILSDQVVKGVSYSRYWHGYVAYLRPLLMVMDLRGVLILLGAVLLVAILALIRALLPDHTALVAVLIAALVLVNVHVAVQCLEFVQTFVLAFALALWVARWKPRSSSAYVYLFALAGTATSFLDMLTTPLLTWGVPLIVLLHVQARGDTPIRRGEAWGLTLVCSTAWIGAYLLAWGFKWMVAGVVLGGNELALAGERIALQAGTQGGSKASQLLDDALGFHVHVRLAALLLNVAALLEADNPPRLAVNLPLYGAIAVVAIVLWGRFRRPGVQGWWVGLLLTIAAVPYAWYAVTAHHAQQHYWFTYRGQLLTLLAAGCAWAHAIDWGAVAAMLRRVVRRT